MWILTDVSRGEIVERAKPGEMVDFCGTLIVVPDVAQVWWWRW